MEANVDKLITGWFERTQGGQLIHDKCGARLTRWHYRFGISIILLGTAAAAASFYWLDLNDPIKMGIGVASGLAALLACMQTFLGLSDRADQHRIASDRYGALQRALEILKTFTPPDPIDLRRSITEIQRQMDRLAESSPTVPQRWKAKIDKRLEDQRQERMIQQLRVAHQEERQARALAPRPNGNAVMTDDDEEEQERGHAVG